MCDGEENRGSHSEWPPWAFTNRCMSKMSQGSENKVKPSSHRGRKPIKNTEMVKKNKQFRCYRWSHRKWDQLPQRVFLMFTFECFYGFSLPSPRFEKQSGSVKQNKKQTNKTLPWLCWSEALFLLRFWLTVVSLPSYLQAKLSLHLALGSFCLMWSTDCLRDSWGNV